ncbi:MAG TPA: DUF1330 domain-containing protein [Thermotogota bacterium]|nr:DUF1330 domain-containing protein [Thermotogota bacterium]HPJ88334.1 DUF1330 domain-containing protein [Thermotogota bacterium]HPR95498.1 DUF1330 domain-containing protein [Thermotogota bacterium]
MSVYFVARINIHDEAAYQRYLENCDDIFMKYNGEYLAVDESPETLEGEMTEGRCVIIRFPDRASLNRWYSSAEYQSILPYRLKGADCQTIVVEGKS